MDIFTRTGADIAPYIDTLAALRISVFRAFPYLYEGSAEYEARHLATYAQCPESLFVLAREGDTIVGASTGMPLAAETDAVRAPFDDAGWDIDTVFYFGESVLEPAYRGRGIGVRFFEEREAYARSLGRFSWCAFCAVERPADHPARPADYVPLNVFWQRRGYAHHPELRTAFSWRDVGAREETTKPMSFWLKRI